MLGATYDEFSIASAVLLHFTMKQGPAVFIPLLTVLVVCLEKHFDVHGEKTHHTRVLFDTAR